MRRSDNVSENSRVSSDQTDVGGSAPRKLGRFRITGELGRGAMGDVLAAHDDSLDRGVALKLLHSEIGEGQAVRLKREGRALAKLSHPNVVQVYEVGTHEDRVFIAMQLVEGKTLREWMNEDSPSTEEVFRVFTEAAAGLSAAHEAGLIHRDFKPENVILASDGRPRVLDFGLAQTEGADVDVMEALAECERSATELVLDETIQVTMTRTGAILGTPAYMSPEQFAGGRVTASSDQFSFCVALWEALHGERPFRGATVAALHVAVAGGRLHAPSKPVVPSAVRRVLERGMATQPKERFESMDALLEALADARERRSKRRRAVWVGAGLAGVLAIGTGAYFGMSDRGAPVVAVEEPSQVPAGFCAPLEERLEGIWDEETRASIDDRYGVESAPRRGREWWSYEQKLLDEWVEDWSRIYTESCENEAEADLPKFSLRQTCLDQRMVEIETRVRLLEELSPGLRADLGFQNYSPSVVPRECENEAMVAAVTLYPADASERQVVLDAQLEFRLSLALGVAAFFGGNPGDFQDSYDRGLASMEALSATGYDPAIAESLALAGNGFVMGGANVEQGFATLDAAKKLGRTSRTEQVAVLAELWELERASELSFPGKRTMADPELDEEFSGWIAALESVGSPVYGTVEVYLQWALYRAVQEDPDGALEKGREAIAAARDGWGEDSYYLARTVAQTAWVLVLAGQDDEAVAMRQDARTRLVDLFGASTAGLDYLLVGEFHHALILEDYEMARRSVGEMQKIAFENFEPGSTPFRLVQLRVALLALAEGKFAEGGAALRELDEDGPRFTAGTRAGNSWRMTRLVYTATVGEPDNAARSASGAADPFPNVDELSRLLAPVLEGKPPAEAAALIEEELATSEFSDAKAAAQIQLGRLYAEMGEKKKARELFEEVLKLEVNRAAPTYWGLLRKAAQHQIDEL